MKMNEMWLARTDKMDKSLAMYILYTRMLNAAAQYQSAVFYPHSRDSDFPGATSFFLLAQRRFLAFLC